MNLLLSSGRYCAVVFLFSVLTSLAWSPVPGHMMTRYAAAINPDTVWAEYPRPQLARPSWVNLNGLWNYAVTQKQTTPPAHWGGQILVPFPIESALSGVGQTLQPNQILWYEHQFHCPPAVYTQLSDVENEVNGILTYDRATVQKVNPDTLQPAVRKLYAP
jgi:hypothetical protein